MGRGACVHAERGRSGLIDLIWQCKALSVIGWRFLFAKMHMQVMVQADYKEQEMEEMRIKDMKST